MTKYPDNVWTVQEAVAYIRKVLKHPDLRVQRFKIETITDRGNTLKLSWDANDVSSRHARTKTQGDH